MNRVSFLFLTQELWLSSWFPQSKDAGKLNFQLPASDNKEFVFRVYFC